MTNPENVPEAVIAAAASPTVGKALAPLSLARIAVLEILASPIIIPGKPWTWQDFANHSYVMRTPIDRLAAETAAGLKQKALTFADTLSVTEAKADLKKTIDQLAVVGDFLPGDTTPGEAKAGAETVG